MTLDRATRERRSSRATMAESGTKARRQVLRWLPLALFASSIALCRAGDFDQNEIRRKRRYRNNDEGGLLEAFLNQEAEMAGVETGRLLQTDLSMPSQAPTVGQPITNNPTLTPGNTGRPTLAPIPIPATPAPILGTNAPTFPGPTMNPTAGDNSCLDGTSQLDFLTTRFSQITDSAILGDPATPQAQALQFLAANDPLQPNVCSYPTLDQRYGLATFFFATTGATWTNNDNWLGATVECDWAGVICTNTSQVLNLTLPSNNLVGSIPNEISTFPAIDRMELALNGLSSTLPTGIGNLTRICVIDLEDNELSGSPFTSELLGLPNLKQLLLSKNRFTGSIPSEIGDMTLMQDFWIADNALVSTLPPQIGQLTRLETLFLYLNRLDGLVPTELAQLTALESLSVYNNTFAGNFTPFALNVPQLTALTSLRFDFNFLTGQLPDEVGSLSSLTDLRFNNNFLSGSLPDSLRNLSDLRFLTLNNNFLQTAIASDVFASYTQLDSLDLSSCFFSGAIPGSIFDVPTIRLVYLNNNGFSGPLPTNLGVAPLLRDLFVDGNQLDGTVPDITPGQLQAMSEFTLQNNLITGTMPDSICALRSTGQLDGLFADCGGATPEIQCDFPACCNRCFENGVGSRRLAMDSAEQLPGMEYVPSVSP